MKTHKSIRKIDFTKKFGLLYIVVMIKIITRSYQFDFQFKLIILTDFYIAGKSYHLYTL